MTISLIRIWWWWDPNIGAFIAAPVADLTSPILSLLWMFICWCHQHSHDDMCYITNLSAKWLPPTSLLAVVVPYLYCYPAPCCDKAASTVDFLIDDEWHSWSWGVTMSSQIVIGVLFLINWSICSNTRWGKATSSITFSLYYFSPSKFMFNFFYGKHVIWQDTYFYLKRLFDLLCKNMY
jgi:hypothetical protein